MIPQSHGLDSSVPDAKSAHDRTPRAKRDNYVHPVRVVRFVDVGRRRPGADRLSAIRGGGRMRTFLILVMPWSLIAGAVYGVVRRAIALRREDRQRELLRRRVNRQIDHPTTWNGDSAA